MQVTRKQLLIFVLVLIGSVLSWFISLYFFMQLSLDEKWVAFYLFFGACFFACLIGWNIERIVGLMKKRHATKKLSICASIENIFGKFKRGDVVVDPPATTVYANKAFTPQKLGATYMQQKLEELKHLSVKGVDHD